MLDSGFTILNFMKDKIVSTYKVADEVMRGKAVETIEYEELGMEAIFMITVKDFPAFIIVDDKGNDFFEKLLG